MVNYYFKYHLFIRYLCSNNQNLMRPKRRRKMLPYCIDCATLL